LFFPREADVLPISSFSNTIIKIISAEEDIL
jgi:hypothetical protein